MFIRVHGSGGMKTTRFGDPPGSQGFRPHRQEHIEGICNED